MGVWLLTLSLLQAIIAAVAGLMLGAGLSAWWYRRSAAPAAPKKRRQPSDTALGMQAVFEATYEFVMLLDGEGTLLNVNQTTLSFCDIDRESVVGHPFWISPLWHDSAKNRRRLEEAVRQVIQGNTVKLEAKARSKGNQIAVIDLSLRPVANAEGETVKVIAEGRDVTAQQQTMMALRATEARYRSLIEQSPFGIAVHHDGKLVYVNPAALQMIGATSLDELKDQVALDFVHPEQLEMARSRIQYIQETGNPAPLLEERLVRLDGSAFDVELAAMPVMFDDQPCIQVVFADITERKQAEAQQEKLKLFYESALNELPIEVSVFDAQARFLFLNPATVKDPVRRARLVGQSVVELAAIDDVEEALLRERHAWLLEVIARKEMVRHEEVATGKNGEEKHILRVAAPVLDENGDVLYVVSYGVDVTDQKQFEAHLLQAKEEAEALARMKTAFLTNMSHEIRTPLTGILGFASVLNEEIGAEHREVVGLIRQSGERLMETLNSILDLARLEANAVTLEPASLDVGFEIVQAVRLYQPLAEEKRLILRTTAEPEEIIAYLDRASFHRILNNLLSNAIKFTDEGYVEVSAYTDGQVFNIVIKDTGAGISKAFMPHLFDEFKQESTGLSRTHVGSGLGLAITRRLIERMGGTIEVESALGAGTCFTVSLPYIAFAYDEEMITPSTSSLHS